MKENISAANKYYQKEKFNKAKLIFTNILDDDPTNITALVGLGNCYYHEYQLYKAEELAVFAEEFESDNASLLTLLGKIKYARGEDEEAGIFLERAISQEPELLEPYVVLGGMMYDNGKYEEAITICKRGLENEANDRLQSIAHFSLSLAYFRQTQYRKAFKEIVPALFLHSTNRKNKIKMLFLTLGNLPIFPVIVILLFFPPMFLPKRIAVPYAITILSFHILDLMFVLWKKAYKLVLKKLALILYFVFAYWLTIDL